MRTTKKQRDEAKKGCEFYHNSYCLSSFCVCMYALREKLKRESNRLKP